jgi:hypothetical protein
MSRLLVQERLLQGMEVVGCTEPFQCDDLTPSDIVYGQLARSDWLAVDVDRAGAAARQAAAKPNRVEVQLVSQDVEEWGVGGRCNGVQTSIHRDLKGTVSRAGYHAW